MRVFVYNSDYESGSSTDSLQQLPPPAREFQSTSRLHRDDWQTQPLMKPELPEQSFNSRGLLKGKSSLEDVMTEFRMNGFDAPYNPDEDKTFQPNGLTGMGPASTYLRQKSWPEPERSPVQRLPRPRSLHDPRWTPGFATSTPAFVTTTPDFVTSTPAFATSTPAFVTTTPAFVTSTPAFATSTPAFVTSTPAFATSASTFVTTTPDFVTSTPDFVTSTPKVFEESAGLSASQGRALLSLPDAVLHALLRGLRHERPRLPQECRFCKNNGEREAYYRSHALKDGAGRVACPVLRAFECRRCGARGDAAHTIKYCPLSTSEERIKSSAMMRSVRMASGRRRHSPAAEYSPPAPAPPAPPARAWLSDDAPLDPLWAALEQKLSL